MSEAAIRPIIQIDKLCDVYPNPKRNENDFRCLLNHLQRTPKECIPFKNRILQHLNIHGVENSNIDLRLLSSCFARATLLFRKTANKSEGPVGVWKDGLRNELRNLETNIDNLYEIIGINTTSILTRVESSKDESTSCKTKLSESNPDFRTTINGYFIRTNLHAHNVCALINVQTDFDLPIPILPLVRIANKIGLLRHKDFNKPPKGLLKQYVYSLTPQLIHINLTMLQSIVEVLGSNIIPYTSSINQQVTRILEWTRSSNLVSNNDTQFHLARSEAMRLLYKMFEILSLNINLEPSVLKELVEVELLENINKLISENQQNSLDKSSTCPVKDNHVIDSLACLEKVITTYLNYCDASLEHKIKSFVIKICLDIYRNFDSTSQVCNKIWRKRFLELLELLANQPYATSTTEMSYHIFELAAKLENDPQIRSVARRALNVGLAHRPIIVSHYDVYETYGRPMLEKALQAEVESTNASQAQVEPPKASQTEVESPRASQVELEPPKASQPEIELPMALQAEVELPKAPPAGIEPLKAVDVTRSDLAPTSQSPSPMDESESYLMHFVDKLASSNEVQSKMPGCNGSC